MDGEAIGCVSELLREVTASAKRSSSVTKDSMTKSSPGTEKEQDSSPERSIEEGSATSVVKVASAQVVRALPVWEAAAAAAVAAAGAEVVAAAVAAAGAEAAAAAVARRGRRVKVVVGKSRERGIGGWGMAAEEG